MLAAFGSFLNPIYEALVTLALSGSPEAWAWATAFHSAFLPWLSAVP